MKAIALLSGLVLSLACRAAAGEGPAAKAPRAVAGDEQDLVLFHDARPYLLRLHQQINGRPFLTNWDGTMSQLFRFLDADGNGRLSKEELARAPSPAQWQQMLQGTSPLEPDAGPDFRAVDGNPGDGKITLEKFKKYYRRSGAGPLQIEWGWRATPADLLTDALFRHLDRNKDGKLSKEELLAAPAVLRKLDVNDDEMVTGVELARGDGSGFVFQSGTDPHPPMRPFPFLPVYPGDAPGTLVRKLLEHYDRNKDGKLSRTEAGFARALFDRLDADHSGTLDARELARWREQTPDLELIVPLEEKSRHDITLVSPPGGKAGGLGAQVHRSLADALLISLPQQQVELVRGVGATTRRPFREALLAEFRALDMNKDKVLDKQEIYRPPFTFVGVLRLADRNGDGKLTEKELSAFLDLGEKIQSTATYLAITDRGRTLFEFLDADHDRRLSARELRSAWPRLASFADRKGLLEPASIPRQFQITFIYPGPRGVGRPDLATYVRLIARPRGPLWFQKMDRNGDGDVSLREFLGTVEQFRHIDADGDGLIDSREAERADRSLRKGKR